MDGIFIVRSLDTHDLWRRVKRISHLLSSLGAKFVNWDEFQDEVPDNTKGTKAHADKPVSDIHTLEKMSLWNFVLFFYMERDIEDSAAQVTNDELNACNSKNNDDEETKEEYDLLISNLFKEANNMLRDYTQRQADKIKSFKIVVSWCIFRDIWLFF